MRPAQHSSSRPRQQRAPVVLCDGGGYSSERFSLPKRIRLRRRSRTYCTRPARCAAKCAVHDGPYPHSGRTRPLPALTRVRPLHHSPLPHLPIASLPSRCGCKERIAGCKHDLYPRARGFAEASLLCAVNRCATMPSLCAHQNSTVTRPVPRGTTRSTRRISTGGRGWRWTRRTGSDARSW